MSCRSGTLVAVTRSPSGPAAARRRSPDLFVLTDATSNAGLGVCAVGDCACVDSIAATNVLNVLSMMLKKAIEWDVIDQQRCTVRQLRTSTPGFDFYDFEEYEQLVAAAMATDPRTYLLVLLTGEAGLRLGEMIALDWTDINLGTRQVCVQRNDWKGVISTPKGNQLRYLPLTTRLTAALKKCRHVRGPRVLYQDDGTVFTEKRVQAFIKRAARRANLRNNGPHIQRHLLFAFGDAWRTRHGDPGAGRASMRRLGSWITVERWWRRRLVRSATSLVRTG